MYLVYPYVAVAKQHFQQYGLSNKKSVSRPQNQLFLVRSFFHLLLRLRVHDGTRFLFRCFELISLENLSTIS